MSSLLGRQARANAHHEGSRRRRVREVLEDEWSPSSSPRQAHAVPTSDDGTSIIYPMAGGVCATLLFALIIGTVVRFKVWHNRSRKAPMHVPLRIACPLDVSLYIRRLAIQIGIRKVDTTGEQVTSAGGWRCVRQLGVFVLFTGACGRGTTQDAANSCREAGTDPADQLDHDSASNPVC